MSWKGQWGGGGGSTVGVSSSSKNRPSHHKFKSPKQFELKQSWKALRALNARWALAVISFWERKVKWVRQKTGQLENCAKKTDKTNIIARKFVREQLNNLQALRDTTILLSTIVKPNFNFRKITDNNISKFSHSSAQLLFLAQNVLCEFFKKFSDLVQGLYWSQFYWILILREPSLRQVFFWKKSEKNFWKWINYVMQELAKILVRKIKSAQAVIEFSPKLFW